MRWLIFSAALVYVTHGRTTTSPRISFVAQPTINSAGQVFEIARQIRKRKSDVSIAFPLYSSSEVRKYTTSVSTFLITFFLLSMKVELSGRHLS